MIFLKSNHTFGPGVLFETVNPASPSATGLPYSIGEGSLPAQAKFLKLLSGPFHYNKNATSYSIDPSSYTTKPLYVDDAQSKYLNEVFWLVFDDVGHWQALEDYRLGGSVESSVKVASRQFVSIKDDEGKIVLEACPLVSREFVAYQIGRAHV